MFEQNFKNIDGILQMDNRCASIGFPCKAFEYLKDSNSTAVNGPVPGIP